MDKGVLQRELSALLRELLDEDRNHTDREKRELEERIRAKRRAIIRLEETRWDGESEFDTREERENHYREE